MSEQRLNDTWQCQSCDCYFPHIPKVLDDDVKRCSKCVEVEILEAKLEAMERLRTEMLNQLRQALDARDGIVESFGEFGPILRAPPLLWAIEPPRDDAEAVLILRANGMTLAEIDMAGKSIAILAKKTLAAAQKE